MLRPPAELMLESVGPSGDAVRFDPLSPQVGNRPLDFGFSTESGKGFSSGSLTLNRARDREYPELALLREWRAVSAAGTIAYEGRGTGTPYSDVIQVDTDGWWSHGEQHKFTDLLLDQDASRWEGMSLDWRSVMAAFTLGPFSDAQASWGRINLEFDRIAQATSVGAVVGGQYRAPGLIGRIRFDLTDSTLAVPWLVEAHTATDDDGVTGAVTDSEANPTGGQTLTVDAAAGSRFAGISLRCDAAHTADGDFRIAAIPRVEGVAIPTLHDRGDGTVGVTAADAIKWLARRYAPRFDLSGVQSTSYPIPTAAWHEPTSFADAAKALNAYHGWQIAVWENRRLTFAPYDLAAATWQVAAEINGCTVEAQGDTTEVVANGMVVNYTGFDGYGYRITPDDAADLRDTSSWIAANDWKDKAWAELDLTRPCSRDDAVAIGMVALAEMNRPKRPSTIKVGRYIQNIHGAWLPSWQVRADQMISVRNQYPGPRRITSTSWSNHELTITTDDAVDTLQAFNARVSAGLQLLGVST